MMTDCRRLSNDKTTFHAAATMLHFEKDHTTCLAPVNDGALIRQQLLLHNAPIMTFLMHGKYAASRVISRCCINARLLAKAYAHT